MSTQQTRWTALVALVATLSAVVGAQAHPLGQHPAVRVNKAAPAIDPNTFIVAHPAQPTMRAGHAGHEHPALTARRDAAQPGIDANSFLVQPPASTVWTHDSAAAVQLVAFGQR